MPSNHTLSSYTILRSSSTRTKGDYSPLPGDALTAASARRRRPQGRQRPADRTKNASRDRNRVPFCRETPLIRGILGYGYQPETISPPRQRQVRLENLAWGLSRARSIVHKPIYKSEHRRVLWSEDVLPRQQTGHIRPGHPVLLAALPRSRGPGAFAALHVNQASPPPSRVYDVIEGLQAGPSLYEMPHVLHRDVRRASPVEVSLESQLVVGPSASHARIAKTVRGSARSPLSGTSRLASPTMSFT